MASSSASIGGTPVLRALNTAHVLRTIRRSAPAAVRIADLIESTGLARPTVTQVVAQLLRTGLILEEPERRETGRLGRPAQVYRLNGLAIPVLGIDIGVHSVAVAVADSAGELLALRRQQVRRPHAKDLAAALDRTVLEALHAGNVSPERIAAVTVVTPGVVDPDTGDVLLIPAISGWQSFNIRHHLQRTFDCPVDIENDANAAVVCVATTRPELGRPLLVVHWGERLGAGIYIADGLHPGAHHAAGEIGLIEATLTTDEAVVRGRLQDLISTAAIGQLADVAARADPGGALARSLEAAAPANHSASLFSAASQQDETASALVDAIVTTFAHALAPVVLALDPQAVVISGGITRAGEVLSDAIEDKLAGVTVRRCPILLSADSENTVVKGAVHLALETAWAALDGGNAESPAAPWPDGEEPAGAQSEQGP